MREKAAMKGSDGSVQKLAVMIAQVVMKGLCVSNVEGDSFIFEGDNWMDPGPRIDLAPIQRCFNNSVLRPGEKLKPCTVESLLWRGWKKVAWALP